MKNLVVWSDCDIAETIRQHGIEAANNPQVRNRYTQMQQLSELSARRFLRGPWEPVIFRDPALTRRSMFRDNWYRIWDLWHQEPCNILYLDSDTLFVNEVDPWQKSHNFQLFNHSFSKGPACFAHYFNAGVRWYPHTMSQDLWDLGASLSETWDLDIWDQEQIIFNHMLWCEHSALSEVHEPRMNWSAHLGADLDELAQLEQANTCAWNQAWIVHYHGSRSSERGWRLAQIMAQRTGTLQ
jgi:hypothetical protein